MHPILIHAGVFTIYSYGVLVATGVLLSLWYARVQAPHAGLDPDRRVESWHLYGSIGHRNRESVVRTE